MVRVDFYGARRILSERAAALLFLGGVGLVEVFIWQRMISER